MNPNYLDRAITALHSLGINPEVSQQDVPVISLLDQVARYDNNKITQIAVTLQQASGFNAVLRDQMQGMQIATRYADIASKFNSIRDDTQQMVQWASNGKPGFRERMKLTWMQMRRGSIPERFNQIRKTYLEVTNSAKEQIRRDGVILDAYADFRMALKSSEVVAQEVLGIASAALLERKRKLQQADASISSCTGNDPAEQARLELARDEALRTVQNEEKDYQIVKDIADDLKTAYHTAELVFARLQQVHVVKERLYQRAITFFSTNEVVFSGLAASFTSMSGLAEASNTVQAMKKGMNDGIETLASATGEHLQAAMQAGYGASIQPRSVQSLMEAIIDFQASSIRLAEELRCESSQAAKDIEAAIEEGKRRFTALVTKGA